MRFEWRFLNFNKGNKMKHTPKVSKFGAIQFRADNPLKDLKPSLGGAKAKIAKTMTKEERALEEPLAAKRPVRSA
jgi:hypothetical protein